MTTKQQNKTTKQNNKTARDEEAEKSRQFIRMLMLEPDGFSDPPGVKVRAMDGIQGLDYLSRGVAKQASFVCFCFCFVFCGCVLFAFLHFHSLPFL